MPDASRPKKKAGKGGSKVGSPHEHAGWNEASTRPCISKERSMGNEGQGESLHLQGTEHVHRGVVHYPSLDRLPLSAVPQRVMLPPEASPEARREDMGP